MEKHPIDLENSPDELLIIVARELQQDTWAEDSIVRTLAKQYFGSDSLTHIMFVANKVLPIVANRMIVYSPYLSNDTKNNPIK